MSLHQLGLTQLAAGLADKVFSAVELAEACLRRVEAVDERLGAFLTLDRERVLGQARDSDGRRARGDVRGPLDGVPIALKDLIAVRDEPLTCASRMLRDFISPYDAHVVKRLKNGGAVLFGRLNMDEFAMGSSNENSSVKPVANPWDPGRIPGGSSGGSAVAVAAQEVPVALGSDTGGSIRQPAALCGVVGLKPTYGRVSRYGLVAFASSLDQIGPFGRGVADVATVLGVIAGHDERDSTSIRREVPDYGGALVGKPGRRRLGVPREYFAEGLDPAVGEAVETAIRWYAAQGHEIVEVSLPHTDLAVPVYYVIATAEASSNLARYDGIRYGHRATGAKDAIDLYFQSRAEGFGDEVKRRIILGTYVLSSGYYDAYYTRAQRVRTLIRRDFLEAFETVDAILTPTSPTTAFRRGEKTADPLAMYLSDIYTLSANLAGIPGLSVPCGFADGLPVGLQLLGKPFDEATLLQLAHAYEQAHPWKDRAPDL
jgi:aspartyl-tRNA(Asn)/glutamyl-tRNA(Gln) amidotransferase subunit A